MLMDNRFEQEITRAQLLRNAVIEESLRIEKNLVDYRRRVGMIRPDDDEAEFAAQAAYRERREVRKQGQGSHE